jgi:hypothetical protein
MNNLKTATVQNTEQGHRVLFVLVASLIGGVWNDCGRTSRVTRSRYWKYVPCLRNG